MQLILVILELGVFAGLLWAFIVWIVPAGTAAIIGFLAICGLAPVSTARAQTEGDIPGVVRWKGPLGLAIVVVAIVMLLVFGLLS